MRGGDPSSTAFWRDTLALIALFGLAYALIARFALHAFPFSGDEYSTLFQAELFARGRLHAPAPPHVELFGVDHVIVQPWLCSKYPPGASALLSLGVLAGAPWLVSPLEGVVTLVAMAIAARRLLAAREALLAVVFLGAAPLFVFHAASFFAHAASTMWFAVAFAAVVVWSSEGGTWRLALAGAAIGCMFLTRPLDAVLVGLALLSLRSVRAVVVAAAAGAPFAAFQLVYQKAQFGSPFVDGYQLYAPTLGAIYGPIEATPSLSLRHVFDGHLANHLDIVRAFLTDWTVPGAALLALLGWGALRQVPGARAPLRLCLAVVVLFLLALLPTKAGPDDGARARYLSLVLVPLALLAAPGWRVARDLLRERVPRVALRVVAAVVWTLPLLQLGQFLVNRMPEIERREGVERAVTSRGIREGIVVVRTRFPTRYARNGPFFDRPVLYSSAPSSVTVAEVAAMFPGKPVYEAREEANGSDWELTP